LVPTAKAVGVLAAVPETRAPLPVMQAQGIAGAGAENGRKEFFIFRMSLLQG
jgi:hypothetical protein